MQAATKDLLKMLAKPVGVIAVGAALVGGVTYLTLPPAPAPGYRVTLDFDPSPSADVIGYRIYYGGATNSLTNMVKLGNKTTVTLTNAPYPFHARVVAYNAAWNESPMGNLAGVLGENTTVNIFAQTNADLSGSNWADAFAVKSVTNPTDILFYRLRIERQSNLEKYP